MGTLLEYSTANQEIDRLPHYRGTGKSPKIRKITWWASVALSITAAFIYGFLLNPEIGLLLTAIALVPLIALVFLSLLLSPRSEVSLPLRLMAVIWGGIGATNFTLLVVDLLTKIFGQPDLNTTVVVQAAIVEESCKGILLFGLYFFARHLIRTPLAGAVLGILCGAGFAFVENILYFNNAFIQGGWSSLWATVLLRAVMSFFLHSMATMFTGMFIGYVVSKRMNLRLWKRIIFLDMGILAAMTVHGMWNGMASLTTDHSKWSVLYFLFWIPFVLLIMFVLYRVRKNYIENKAKQVVSAVRHGYIQMQQAERILNKTERKALYKNSAAEVIQWEDALLRIHYWNESLAVDQKIRKVAKLNKKKSKDMLRLAEVVTIV